MHDMVTALQVSTRWRQIALSTASLWRDVQLTSRSVGMTDHSSIIASRAKDTPIDVNVSVSRVPYAMAIAPGPVRDSTQRILRQHGHHIASLEFNFDALGGSTMFCSLAALPIF